MLATDEGILSRAVKFSEFTEEDMADMLDANLEDVRAHLTHLYTIGLLEVYMCGDCQALHYRMRRYAA